MNQDKCNVNVGKPALLKKMSSFVCPTCLRAVKTVDKVFVEKVFGLKIVRFPGPDLTHILLNANAFSSKVTWRCS